MAGLLSSTNPRGNRRAWKRFTPPQPPSPERGSNLIYAVSGHFKRLAPPLTCSARALSTLDPSGAGPAARSFATLEHFPLFGVSCQAWRLCVAVDTQGQVAVATHPTAGRRAWSFARVDGHRALFAMACPSRRLCVATDHDGNVVTSTHPTGGAHAWKVAHIDPHHVLYGLACPCRIAVRGSRLGRERRQLDSTPPQAPRLGR